MIYEHFYMSATFHVLEHINYTSRNVREIPVVLELKFPSNSFIPRSDLQQACGIRTVWGSGESSREIWVHSFSLGLGGSVDFCRILNKKYGVPCSWREIGAVDLWHSKREHMPRCSQ